MKGKLTTLARTGGIKLDGKDTWINPSPEVKDAILENLDDFKTFVNKNVVLEMDGSFYTKINLDEDQTQESSDISEYMINLHGKQFVTHAGLVAIAHNKGLKSIETELVDAKVEGVVFKARVVMKDGTEFTGFGDANGKNVSSNIAVHYIRMAETRAINRALRLATNVAVCSIEELGGDKDGNKAPDEDRESYEEYI
jgi:hypothetical protein